MAGALRRLASLLALRCAVAVVDVWIDTDNSAGVGGGVRDVDDAWALLHLLNAKDVHVVAVSTVFGNADVDAVTKATRALLKASGHTGVPCFRGAAHAGDRNTTASRRLRAHLDSKTSMTLVSLGALTNVAGALDTRPDLQEYAVDELIAVAGRRPGAALTVGDSETGLADLNFEKDWEAFADVLRGFTYLVLAPFELSRQVAFARDDALAVGETRNWLAAVTAPWLDFWSSEFGVDYFHPFDLLASARLLHRNLLECDEKAHAWIVRGKSEAITENIASVVEGDASAHGIGVASKMYLHVGDLKGAPVAATAKRKRHLVYCHTAKPGLKAALLEDLKTDSGLRRTWITDNLRPGAPREL